MELEIILLLEKKKERQFHKDKYHTFSHLGNQGEEKGMDIKVKLLGI